MRFSFVFACCYSPQFVGVFVLLLHDVNRKSLQLFCFCRLAATTVDGQKMAPFGIERDERR